jgi:DNA-directed RNA polymerase subunit K/omega
MSVKTQASLIDVNLCTEKMDNRRYDLVLVAAARMRELRFHRTGTDKITRISEVLMEIQEGQVDRVEYLHKIKPGKRK